MTAKIPARGAILGYVTSIIMMTLGIVVLPVVTAPAAAAATTTITGLTVQCVLDTNEYPIGVKYTNADIDALPLTRHDFHGEWNYTLTPPDTP